MTMNLTEAPPRGYAAKIARLTGISPYRAWRAVNCNDWTHLRDSEVIAVREGMRYLATRPEAAPAVR